MVELMIQRIFYPIGQGAFYAEIHEKFKIVYDCGEWKQSKKSEKLVRQSFSSNDVIDILFISHFDWDHISRICTLRDTVKNINRVIMPLLHDEEKIFMLNIHKALGYQSETLILDPELFFGKETEIIYVEPAKEGDYSNDDSLGIDIEEIKNKSEIKSGTKITSKIIDCNWIFIPFNMEIDKRSKVLKDKLQKEGFDIDKLEKDPDYLINILINKDKKNKIKDIYNSLKGKINQNSMLVYSGVDNHIEAEVNWYHKDINCFYCCTLFYTNSTNNVSCVYTGDADLNTTDIETIFKKYWSYVGTVQIPHHGSLADFNSNFLDKPLVCPISFGENNTYGHPSLSVISQIISKNGIPLKITENLNTGAIQTINFCQNK